jgi:hypothetical protein
MNEIGNTDKKRSKFYWELDGSGNAYPYFQETHSFTSVRCDCGLMDNINLKTLINK